MSLKYNGKLIPFAKNLRKNQTRQERHLWYDYLKDFPVRFQRQKTIGGYIVDFYCHKVKLAIELDGGQHFEYDAERYDAKRTEFLNNLGVTVLRFTNIDVDKNFNEVCYTIEQTVNSLSHFVTAPSEMEP